LFTRPSPWGEGAERSEADEGYIGKKQAHLTPHQSKIKDFCQLLPREKLYANNHLQCGKSMCGGHSYAFNGKFFSPKKTTKIPSGGITKIGAFCYSSTN
jgi:hypothetical protein